MTGDLRFRATIIAEYGASPRHYSTEDVQKMLEMDKGSLEQDPSLILGDSFTVKVEDITEETKIDE